MVCQLSDWSDDWPLASGQVEAAAIGAAVDFPELPASEPSGSPLTPRDQPGRFLLTAHRRSLQVSPVKVVSENPSGAAGGDTSIGCSVTRNLSRMSGPRVKVRVH